MSEERPDPPVADPDGPGVASEPPEDGTGAPSSVPPAQFSFAGWGTAEKIDDLEPGDVEVAHLDQEHKHTIGVWPATAICGNDITSSCLYVSALAAAHAGALAPVALAIVAAVLFLFRKVYAEVGSALPLNGGTYTVLLNTTNKKLAAGAAVLTLLSYVATAVISAGEAMEYAQHLFGSFDLGAIDVFWATVGLLGLFALLNLIGIAESSVVASVIFVFHILTLIVLSAATTVFVVRDPSLLAANWSLPSPGGFLHALYFGFAASMLGISGFESSANFIEEQKPGVFPRTLRNMWAAVSIFNPLISLLSLGVLPLLAIQAVPKDLLAQMGDRSAGQWLAVWVSVDAVLVLSGAVLTSFVGVTGLVRRMALDRCLPQLLLRENRLRGTNHWIILAFFGVCCSILVSTEGHVTTLAGVYTISFLSVMALFAIGNMLLKVKRNRLPRETRAGWPTVSVALGAVLLGLAGNILLDPKSVRVFTTYFLVFGLAVALMFLRVQLLKVALFMSAAVVTRLKSLNEWSYGAVKSKIDQINDRVVVYFTRGDSAVLLNRAALYVLQNEQTTRLKVVHVYQKEEDIPEGLAQRLHDIDHLYPDLRIDFLAVQGEFTPAMIELLSKRLNVPKNYMFIGTPGDRFPHRIDSLGGVRLIL